MMNRQPDTDCSSSEASDAAPCHILLVDDDAPLRRLLAAGLASEGYKVTSVASGVEALVVTTEQEPDVVVTDLNMPGMSGIELCAHIAERYPDVPVIVLTAFGSLDTAVQAIRNGAYDFVAKPVEPEVLGLAIARARRHHELRGEVKRLRALVTPAPGQGGLVGESVEINALRSMIARIAGSAATVLIAGESGSGKEIVARALHEASPRQNRPFVAVNCAAMPEPLLESELFGHVKGAFTDARSDRPGLMREANGGTLLLDEIGDMPLTLQPKLLRALEERRVRPVGGSVEVPFDVRILAATNRDLEAAVAEGRFREDLYYRLNVLPLRIPPLRNRGGDILILAQRFLAQFAGQAGKEVLGLASSVAERLLAYPWPGNVRELRNCMEYAVALTSRDRVSLGDLPERIHRFESRYVVVAGERLDELVPLEEVERRYILRVLDSAGGNKSLAAHTLGLNRKTLYRKLVQYGVEAKEDG